MDIRTKLVFALVSVSLGSMLAFGLTMYTRVEEGLRVQTLEQLEGLAEFKKDAVEGIVAGWHDRVGLVASRTQLRMSLRVYNRTGSEESLNRIRRILSDALSGSALFVRLWVHDPEGRIVTSAGPPTDAASAASADADTPTHAAPGEGTQYVGVTFRDGVAPTVNFTAPLAVDGARVGFLHAVLRIDEIVAVSTNYVGLGESGETMVVAADDLGQLRVLHPVRHPQENSGTVQGRLVVGPTAPASRALRGEEASFTEDVTDYRGEEVWAATRLVRETDWGVVVKVDAAEQGQPIVDFRTDMIRLAMTLSAFAILFGTILGFRFAQPIHVLAEAANRIRGGELGARSNIVREDEVGLLARTFDEMADELEEQVALLSEFRSFFDMSLDMLCIASTDGYFRRVNAAFVHELGWPEEKLLKRPFYSLVHPDDVESTREEIEKLAGGSPTIAFENRFLCMDGEYKLLRWNAFPEEGTGRLFAIARVLSPKPQASS